MSQPESSSSISGPHIQLHQRRVPRNPGIAPLSERANPSSVTGQSTSTSPLRLQRSFSTSAVPRFGSEEELYVEAEENPPSEDPEESPENLGPELPPTEAHIDKFLHVLDKLSDAIGGMHPSAPSRKTKLREPKPFDGKNPYKLREFLVLVQLNLNAKPEAYDTDEKKIHYVLTYLTGSAMDWFEPEILYRDPQNPPSWRLSFDSFIEELSANFGPYDPIGDAEIRLGEL
jgi:hypothetical protein